MNKKLAASLIFSLLAVLTLLGACTGQGEPAPAIPEVPDVPQILRVNLGAEPNTLDPSLANLAQERTVIMQVFEGLLGFNQDLTLKPVVAKEIPSVANKGISADGKTYTFNLRDDVTWSDGQKVTAQDFVYSIKRMLGPDLAAKYASSYFDIIGAKEYYDSADADAAAKSQLMDAVAVTAIDDSTLQITLSKPRPTFLQLMALWPTYPLREDIITLNGDKWIEPASYIGNGPFLLTEWAHQDHITLEANPQYWGEAPKLAEIQFKMITDVNAELAAYKNNELDMSNVPPGTEKAIMADPALSGEIVRYPELRTYAFFFNLASPPYDNLKLRQALATAIDRVSFVENVRNGVGETALSWIPPGMPGHDPDLGTQYNFDVNKAKELLAEAGYADVSALPELTFQYADTGGNRLVAQFLQGQLKDNLGIELTIEPIEPKSFGKLLGGKNFTWIWLSWGADYPDADNWLPELFGTGAGNNLFGYSNAKFDAAIEQAELEFDNAKRLQKWGDAQEVLMEDCPIVTMYYRERFVLYKPNVEGIKVTGMDGRMPGDLFLEEVSIGK